MTRPAVAPAVPLPAAPAPPVAPGLAIAAAALAVAVFVGMDTLVKLLSPRYGALQLTFFRFASGLAFALVAWLAWRTPLPARRDRRLWRMHLWRSSLLMVTLGLYFYALSVLPLAQAVMMGYTAPIFTSLLAMAVLRERPSRWVWLALACGAAGALVAMGPELAASRGTALSGLLAGLASAVSFAGVLVLTRQQARTDALPTFLLLQNLLPALMLAGPAALTWNPVAPGDLWLIAAVGLCASIGLAAITWAFRHQEASRLAPVEYSGLVWAGALGYLAFGEVPTLSTALAAALIVTGCLLLLRR